jgi:hypothetical protein
LTSILICTTPYSSTSSSSKCSLSFRFPHENSLCSSILSHMCDMHCPSHSLWFIPKKIFAKENSWNPSLRNHPGSCFDNKWWLIFCNVIPNFIYLQTSYFIKHHFALN